MIALTESARKSLGKRASAYVIEHAFRTYGGWYLVSDRYETPDGIRRTLTRVYSRPQTVDRGEIGYWTIDDGDVIDATEVTS